LSPAFSILHRERASTPKSPNALAIRSRQIRRLVERVRRIMGVAGFAARQALRDAISKVSKMSLTIF